jgi:hypothetical protein
MEPRNRSILDLPIAEAGIDGTLAKEAKSHGYPTLADLLRVPLTELVKTDWITPTMWTELVRLVASLPPADHNIDQPGTL